MLLTPERVLGLLPAAVEQRLEDVRAHQADLLRLLGRRVRRRLRMRRQRRHLRHHNLAVSGQDGGVRHLRVVLRLHLYRRKRIVALINLAQTPIAVSDIKGGGQLHQNQPRLAKFKSIVLRSCCVLIPKLICHAAHVNQCQKGLGLPTLSARANNNCGSGGSRRARGG